VIVTVLGTGFGAAIKSFIVSLATPDELGLLYTITAFFGSIGVLVSTPLFAFTLSWGIQKGGLWAGTPFLIATILYCISAVFTWMLYVPADAEDDENT